MKTSNTIKQFFAGVVGLVLICFSGCTRANSSKELDTQKNLATQLAEKSEFHVLVAESYAYGYRTGALRRGQPVKEIDCIVNQLTPELALPVVADVFDKKCSDDELRQAISFYESETGKTYMRNEAIRNRSMIGMSTEEPPEYSPSDKDRIVAFEQTLVGKLIIGHDTSLRDALAESMRKEVTAISYQCE